MGRLTAPIPTSRKDIASGRRGSVRCSLLASLLLSVSSLCLSPLLPSSPGALLSAAPAGAQTLTDRLTRSAKAKPGGAQAQGEKAQDRLLVDADEFVYNRDANTISASGNVQLYYQGRTLQSDRVTYNQTTKRVLAEGRAKMTERDGTVAYSERFELTDDFREGFIDSLRTETADKTYFSAGRAERIAGDVTVFENGTYTACEACKEDPTKPPLWRVRAKRIIHKNSEQTIYYEDATLELWGMPIAWLPFFSSPDPSVKRKSGVLAPRYIANSKLGVGASVPLYWALSPNYDLTVTPTILSRQGALGTAIWRHKLLDGAYNVRASGIFQQDPDAFLGAPYGSGNQRFRGSLESNGQFHINEKWRLGWDVTVLSDRWFLQDYRLNGQVLSSTYFKEAISTVYLTGQADRGYFDLRGYKFQGLSSADLEAQQPLVAPLLDYNKTFDLSPSRTAGIGGQVEVDFNFTNIARELASFEAIGGRRLDRAYQLYDVCETTAGVRTYNRDSCLIRGMGGNYTRATANLSWKRKFIDPIGQVWTPFAFAHVNGAWMNLNFNQTAFFGAPGCDPLVPGQPCSVLRNADQSNFFGNIDQNFLGQITPGVGLEYRYPLIAYSHNVTHVLEPIVQVISRPATTRNRSLVNEDAQSLVFDDTNLFEWSKYSGYDRFEGGTRTNMGLQYSAVFAKGGYANLLVGQSTQLLGPNSYANPDVANVGLGSGLDTRRSDYVARAAFAPNSTYSFIAKGRFDPTDFSMRRLDLIANANFGTVEAALQYARYEAQPLIGYDKRREGFVASAKYKVNENVFLTGNVITDMSRHLYTAVNGDPLKRAPLFSVAGLGIGAGYTDECTTVAVQYTSILQNNNANSQTRNQTLTLQLQLRTLGDTRLRSSLGEIRVQDGLTASSAR
ncbi:MAG: Organic solvent tolerance protein [Hyphomicrobiales bacterium]|nr:Organic solvent tolerance protein [Hyphomicrobiales bacterium]